MRIICKIHGPFEQLVGNHKQGFGCKHCATDQRKISDKTQKLKSMLPDGCRLISPIVNRVDDVLLFSCDKHGEFERSYDDIKNGYICRQCDAESKNEKRIDSALSKFQDDTQNRFPVLSKDAEGFTVECVLHGSFFVNPKTGKNATGCKECRNLERRTSLDRLMPRFIDTHGEKYDYSKSTYTGYQEKMEIECPDHGVFFQTPDNHIRGGGCPKCLHTGRSKAEDEIYEIVRKIDPNAIQGDRISIGKELDIVSLTCSLAIEYCGVYWHSEKCKKEAAKQCHIDKYRLCCENELRLLTIFEDEWVFQKDKVVNAIQSAMGVRSKGIGARQMKIKPISNSDAATFLDLHHLQGRSPTQKSYGAFDQTDNLAAVMTFGIPSRPGSSHSIELRRFATDGRSFPGVASKIFGRAIKDNEWTEIVSFSDNRWFTGQMYRQLGFDLISESGPDYSYVVGNDRHHKSRYTRKGISKLLPHVYSEDLSESQMMTLAGISKIWDCGKKKWVWTKKDIL